MKLNKYILGLLIAPAFALAGCSDYEDTESQAPQADENAIGANFSAASTPVVMHRIRLFHTYFKPCEYQRGGFRSGHRCFM